MGGRPRGIAIGPNKLNFSDRPSSALKVVDVAKRAVIAETALGKSSEGVYLSADAKLVAIAVEESNSVAIVGAATHSVLANVRVPGQNPEHAAFSPDGAWIFVGAEDANSVDVIDVRSRQHVASITVGTRPRGIAFTPDSRIAFVACEIDSTVY